MDGLEQRLNGQEQSQRTLQELFMKLSQEVKVKCFLTFLQKRHLPFYS